MAIIVIETADNAIDIANEFRKLNCDRYPFGVYDAIFRHIEREYEGDEVYNFNALDWHRIIKTKTLEDEPEFATIEELAEHLKSCTDVLYHDAETVYHIIY